MEEAKIQQTSKVTSMDSLDLLPFNDPLLKTKPTPFDFEKNKAAAKEIKKTLIDKMYELGGVGLSANQVGLDMAVFVIGDGQVDGMQKAFFNPLIMGCGEEQDSMKEGCACSCHFPLFFVSTLDTSVPLRDLSTSEP